MQRISPTPPFVLRRNLKSWLATVALCGAMVAATMTALRPAAESTGALTASTGARTTQNTATAAHYGSADGGDPARLVAAPAPKPRPIARPQTRKPAPVVHRVPPAPSAPVIGSTQQALINSDRARYGLRPLTWSSCLASIAYSNALRMARQGFISHTNGPERDLGCSLGYHAGENVGWYSAGVNDTWANGAFMASPDHRANILSPYYHYVATSWVRGANGRAYIAVEFS